MYIKRFTNTIRTVLVAGIIGMTMTNTAFALDFNNYDIQGKSLLDSESIDFINWYMEDVPDYILNNYLGAGKHIDFRKGQLEIEDAMGVYFHDTDEINLRVDLKSILHGEDPKTYYGMNMLHELGHYYYYNYKDKLSDEAKQQMFDNYIYYSKFSPEAKDESETFATLFAIYYKDSMLDEKTKLPYNEIDQMISGRMEENGLG